MFLTLSRISAVCQSDKPLGAPACPLRHVSMRQVSLSRKNPGQTIRRQVNINCRRSKFSQAVTLKVGQDAACGCLIPSDPPFFSFYFEMSSTKDPRSPRLEVKKKPGAWLSESLELEPR